MVYLYMNYLYTQSILSHGQAMYVTNSNTVPLS